MDNMSLKEIQSKLLLWEAPENPLAPLTSEQREAIFDLESLILGVSTDSAEVSIYFQWLILVINSKIGSSDFNYRVHKKVT